MNRGNYATMPSIFEKWDANHTLVNYDIEDVEKKYDETTTRREYECNQLLIEGDVTYPKLVSALIRTKYSMDDEFALLRQAADKQEEYNEYTSYAEECKGKAKQLMESL